MAKKYTRYNPKPSKYKPEYCEKLIAHMSEGYSYDSFPAIVDCCRDTLYEWEKKHPEFAAAKKKAFAMCLMWWERTGHQGMFMGGKDSPFQASMYNFQMSARFGWSQKKEQKVQVSNLENLIDESFNDKDE